VTAWNLAMAYGLEAYWADRVATVATRPTSAPGAPSRDPSAALPQYGYVIDGASSDVYPMLVRLMSAECKVRVGSKPFTIGGRSFRPGAALLRRHENPADLAARLRQGADGLLVDVQPVDTALCENGPDLGGPRFHLLQPPQVAIASQWPMSTTSFGAIWHLLDQRLGLRSSPINVQELRGIDLRKYNVLVLPNAAGGDVLGAALNEGAIAKLKAWIGPAAR
jgi:hypothetical protein